MRDDPREEIIGLLEKADTYRLLLVRAYLRALLGLTAGPVAEQN